MDNLTTIYLSASILVFIWVTVLSILYYKAVRHYRRLAAGMGERDLKKILEEHFSHIGKLDNDVRLLYTEIERIRKADLKHLQRVGLVRFNPFDETGGNQSFALALLDAGGNGVVVSSLHSRETTRIYGKPVENWSERGFEFSNEEKQAIEMAKKET